MKISCSKAAYITLCLLLSCSDDKPGLSVETLSLDIERSKPVDYSEWFSEITYLPLQSKAGHYLVDISKVRVADKGIFILEDANTERKLTVFDLNGAFKTSISNPGEGPGKFLSVDDFWINPEEGTIELLDQAQQKIVKYRMDGGYLDDIPLKVPAKDLLKFSEEEYAFYADNMPGEEKKNFYWYDLRKGLIHSDFDIPDFEMGAGSSHWGFSFNEFNGNYLFSLPFSNILYEVNKTDKISPILQVDLGNYWLQGDLLQKYKKLSSLERLDLLNTAGKVRHFRLLANFEDNIFFSFFLQQKLYICLYDLRNKKTYLSHFAYSERNPNDFDMGMPLFNLCSIYQDNLVFFIQPYNLKTHINSLDNEKLIFLNEKQKERFSGIKKLASSLDEEDNPVLVFAKLKSLK